MIVSFQLVNLTPHAVTLRHAGGDVTIQPAGTVARVTSTPGAVFASAFHTAEGGAFQFPVAAPTTFGAVEGLPDPTPGTMFIVSALVGSALKGARSDVVMPGTGPNDGAVRNDKGHIVAVTRLVLAG